MGYEALRNKLMDADGKLTQGRTILCGLGAGKIDFLFEADEKKFSIKKQP